MYSEQTKKKTCWGPSFKDVGTEEKHNDYYNLCLPLVSE